MPFLHSPGKFRFTKDCVARGGERAVRPGQPPVPVSQIWTDGRACSTFRSLANTCTNGLQRRSVVQAGWGGQKATVWAKGYRLREKLQVAPPERAAEICSLDCPEMAQSVSGLRRRGKRGGLGRGRQGVDGLGRVNDQLLGRNGLDMGVVQCRNQGRMN